MLGSRVGDAGMRELVQSLPYLSRLEVLLLGDSGLGDEALKVLTDCKFLSLRIL